MNQTAQIQQQQQHQPQHHPHQHQNVRIAEVTPNSNQYSQKPKKVPVNDADKYNLSPEVTVSDYDIYDSQVRLYPRIIVRTSGYSCRIRTIRCCNLPNRSLPIFVSSL